MSTDISVQAVAVNRAGSDSVNEPKAAVSQAAQPSEPAPMPPPIFNPTLRLEPALGLVVIEFRNDSGAITTSIPSQRQIEAYQRWEATQFGPAPAGESPPRSQRIAVSPVQDGKVDAHQSEQERASEFPRK